MRIDLGLQHLIAGILQKQLLFVVFVDQRVDLAEHRVHIAGQRTDLIGGEGLDKALAHCDIASIVNGRYDGMPENVYNGAGRFAMSLLDCIATGWEDYTTIVPEIAFEELDGDDIYLDVFAPFEGLVTVSE